MTEIKMLPLPKWCYSDKHLHVGSGAIRKEVRGYSSAVAKRNVAARDAEIEALRALLLEACDDGDESDADLLATLERARTAEARAERLAEALRELVEYVQETAHHNAPAAAAARAALRDHDQEVGNGFWPEMQKSGGTDWTGFDG